MEQANYGSYQDIPNLSLEDEIMDNLAAANHRGGLQSESALDVLKYNKQQFSPDGESELLSHFSDNIAKENFLSRPNSLKNFMDKSDQQMIMDASEDFTEKLVSCEYGVISDCPLNEECVRLLSKSRSGLCKCSDGFVRNITGVCTLPRPLLLTPYSKSMEAAAKMADIGSPKSVNLSKADKADPNSKDATETSSKPNVNKLTVSALSKEVCYCFFVNVNTYFYCQRNGLMIPCIKLL